MLRNSSTAPTVITFLAVPGEPMLSSKPPLPAVVAAPFIAAAKNEQHRLLAVASGMASRTPHRSWRRARS